MYDISDVDSFHKVDVWVNELKTYLTPETPILIAGNKSDMHNRQISVEDAELYGNSIIIRGSYAKGKSMEHFSTSAKTGLGVQEVFKTLA